MSVVNPLSEYAAAASETPPASVETPPAAPVETPPASPEFSPDAGVTPEAPAAPAPSYFDTEAYKDHLVKLKIGGEDVEMSMQEALASAMRGQDYTRKTQQLAEERRKLAQADAIGAMLDADPQNTIRQLAEMYDLDVSGLVPIQRAPEEQAAVERQRQLQRQEQQFQQQRVQWEIGRLVNEYGVPETDIPQVARYAVDRGVDLETAYKAMQFDSLKTQQSEQARMAAAQEAARRAQIVQQGGTGQGGVTPPPAPTAKNINSIRDAFELTRQQLKLN